MPAIYTRGGLILNENILLKIFAFDDSASEARTPCIAKGWEAVRRGPYITFSVRGLTCAVTIAPDQSTVAVVTKTQPYVRTASDARLNFFDAATGQLRHSISHCQRGISL